MADVPDNLSDGGTCFAPAAVAATAAAAESLRLTPRDVRPDGLLERLPDRRVERRPAGLQAGQPGFRVWSAAGDAPAGLSPGV